MKNRTNRILSVLFFLSLLFYLLIFADCFSEFPINPSPLQQALILSFHFLPMFTLQLLLCRLEKPLWQRLLPFLPLLIVGGAVLALSLQHILVWLLLLWWGFAPALGAVLAWLLCPLRRRSNCPKRGVPRG